jgi:hypothetical protein
LNQITLLLGVTSKDSLNNPLYQINQNLTPSTAIYLQGNNEGNILGINQAINGNNITGNIFVEQNLNTNNTYIRGVIGKSF